jgi:hypothetical protein
MKTPKCQKKLKIIIFSYPSDIYSKFFVALRSLCKSFKNTLKTLTKSSKNTINSEIKRNQNIKTTKQASKIAIFLHILFSLFNLTCPLNSMGFPGPTLEKYLKANELSPQSLSFEITPYPFCPHFVPHEFLII